MPQPKTTNHYVVIGTSPFADVSVGVGPVNSYSAANALTPELELLGYVTEVVQLICAADVGTIGFVENEEGA